MFYIKRYKGRALLICFLAVTLSLISPASPLSTDIRESLEIGPKGGIKAPEYHIVTNGTWKQSHNLEKFNYD